MLEQQLAHYRDNALGVLMFLLVEDYEECFLRAYRGHGFDDIRRADGAVLRNLGEAGAPISQIALRAGITKQSIGRTVRDLERRGYVEVNTALHDARVRNVHFSAKGQVLVQASTAIVDEILKSYTELLGRAAFKRLRTALQHAVSALAIDLSFIAGNRSASARFYHFGRLLVELAADFERRLVAAVPAEQRALISRPTLTVLYVLEAKGCSISALASSLPVTVQAVSQTVRQLVAQGLVQTQGSTVDSRAREVVLTGAGVALLHAVNQAIAAVRVEYARAMGDAALAELENGLRALVSRLQASA